mmetsp:Transcript_69359/g.167767  ORF Transcript_69359/g.167767 Transcript_69359/m.167767 type:complete len:133 (-) Transcript_69359:1292-1690(-)
MCCRKVRQMSQTEQTRESGIAEASDSRGGSSANKVSSPQCIFLARTLSSGEAKPAIDVSRRLVDALVVSFEDSTLSKSGCGATSGESSIRWLEVVVFLIVTWRLKAWESFTGASCTLLSSQKVCNKARADCT